MALWILTVIGDYRYAAKEDNVCRTEEALEGMQTQNVRHQLNLPGPALFLAGDSERPPHHWGPLFPILG